MDKWISARLQFQSSFRIQRKFEGELEMAKTKRADNEFNPSKKFLTRVINVRWTSLPGVDPHEPGIMIQVKLGVLCSVPVKAKPRLCGLQAVVFVPVKKVQGNLGAEGKGAEFLKDLDIPVPPVAVGGVELRCHKRWLVCQFGEADPVHKYQSIINWKLAMDREAKQLVNQAIEADLERRCSRGPRIPLRENRKTGWERSSRARVEDRLVRTQETGLAVRTQL